jgi:hypothetical protein
MRRNTRRFLGNISISLFSLPVLAELAKGSKNPNKKSELEFIKEYAKRMHTQEFYKEKIHLLDMLYWLIAYYEDRASCTPKEYLEVLIDAQNLYGDIKNSERIRLLYNWINYKKIVGF